jgi:hypothetical protein
MGTTWSSRQFVAAQSDSFILIGDSDQPEVQRIAKALGLTKLETPKDIRRFVVEDCGLNWNGLKLEKSR